MAEDKKIESAVTYKMIAEALFENYESIYDIHLETQEYKTYYQSSSYQDLKLSKQGKDFFAALPAGIRRSIAPEDQDYVLRMLSRKALTEGLNREKYYRLVYRIQQGDRKLYHQLRATWQKADDGMHILMGIKNIDDLIRQRMEHDSMVESMQQKEYNHLEAVLASAAAYLEANLSRNLVLEKSIGNRGEDRQQIRDIPPVSEIPAYDDMQNWIVENLVTENGDRYSQVSSRSYLMECFRKGDRRASVSFSLYARDGGEQPCRAVFFLYQEKTTGDLCVFCVIYDLTDQQKKEKEMEELEKELSMSRIRNSTSQMQPHFLYNALGSIQELMLLDPAHASDLLGDFTIHLRSCVRAMSSDEPIPFSEELKNIRAYVNIEKMRLGTRLDMQYDILTDQFPVLPLTIQPLVENAIRHGVHKRGKRGGAVVLCTKEDPGAWVVCVKDTGVGFDVKKVFLETEQGRRDSTGLLNIRFRLEKVMGGSVDIQSREGEGTTVTVLIPKGGNQK